MAYPYLEDFIRENFGIDIWLRIPMFGFWVAIGIFTAIALVRAETRRKVKEGVLTLNWPTKDKNGDPLDPVADYIDHLSIVSVLIGIIGARIFHILEYPDQFLNDPIGSLISRGGLTIYGALICGAFAGIWYTTKKKISVPKMMDACAPGMFLGYAVGRIGCQLAGDGDWGIPADMALKPDWLPTYLWASQYVNNVLGQEIPAPGVYPTPLYETVMTAILWIPLWFSRRHSFAPGWLFAFYAFLAGIERLLIEQIRVNSRYEFLGFSITQAEIISSLLIVGGLGFMIYLMKKPSDIAAKKA